MAIFFFCGVGGIGMSSIALYLRNKGFRVMGSDRSFDRGTNQKMYDRLRNAGVELFPQDGSGVNEQIDVFVVSSAVEDSIPDVRQAQKYQLTIKKRAEVLAEILHNHEGIAVAGTSGKTTVTAMIGHILARTGFDPVMINGGISLNTYHGQPQSNLIFGQGDSCVIEADESDGSIELYTPNYAVVTNISLDHKSIDEIKPLFESFLNRTQKGIVVNADCPYTQTLNLSHKNKLSFSVTGKLADLSVGAIKQTNNHMLFTLNGLDVDLPVIGSHNVENALAAMGICLHMGIPLCDSITALSDFKGTHRRLETVGQLNGITVIDDYAHNPEKIRAAIKTLKQSDSHLFVVYQPHGFAPLRLMKQTLTDMLLQELDDHVTWIMNDVYYAGGTVAKDISSADIVAPLIVNGKNAVHITNRPDTRSYLTAHVKQGDRIVVMGARDDTLSQFACDILSDLKRDVCE